MPRKATKLSGHWEAVAGDEAGTGAGIGAAAGGAAAAAAANEKLPSDAPPFDDEMPLRVTPA